MLTKKPKKSDFLSAPITWIRLYMFFTGLMLQERGDNMTTRRGKWILEYFSRRQNIQLIASALSTHLVISLVYLSSVFAGTSGVFTEVPFNGLQIVYSIDGAELGAPVDGGPFCCWDRTYTGTIAAGSTLSLSGTGILNRSFCCIRLFSW